MVILIDDRAVGSIKVKLRLVLNGSNKAAFASSTCETKTPSDSKKLSMRSSNALKRVSSFSVSSSAAVLTAISDCTKGYIFSSYAVDVSYGTLFSSDTVAVLAFVSAVVVCNLRARKWR